MKSSMTVDALDALASDARLTVFRLLVKRGPTGYTPTELARRLEVPAHALSLRLMELARAGLPRHRADHEAAASEQPSGPASSDA